MMFRIIRSVHAFTLEILPSWEEYACHEMRLEGAATCPCSVIPAGLSLEQIIASLWLGFSVLHPFLGVFFFLLYFVMPPPQPCLSSSVLSQDATFSSCSGAWGNQRGHRFIAFNFVKRQIKIILWRMCALSYLILCVWWFLPLWCSYPAIRPHLPWGKEILHLEY